MVLFGCLIAAGVAIAPRLVLILAWLFGRRWDLVWQGNWIFPLLGIVFLPYTTVMYLLVWTPAGMYGLDWFWLALGVMLDLVKWMQVLNNRRFIPGYPGSSSERPGPAYSGVGQPGFTSAPTQQASGESTTQNELDE